MAVHRKRCNVLKWACLLHFREFTPEYAQAFQHFWGKSEWVFLLRIVCGRASLATFHFCEFAYCVAGRKRPVCLGKHARWESGNGFGSLACLAPGGCAGETFKVRPTRRQGCL